jgi:streptogramin lyase
MAVDEDQRFWWTDVTTKGLGSIEPLSADPESTIRCMDLPGGSLPMQPRLSPGGTTWYTDAARSGFGRIDAAAPDPAATLVFYTASDVRTPFNLQNVGDYMMFTDRESGIGRGFARSRGSAFARH